MTDALREAALECAFSSCVLVDRSDLALLRATGPDFLDLLDRLSTGKVRDLTEGKGAATVLTTPKGRIVERLFVHHLGDAGVVAVCGAERGGPVLEHLRRFTFAEKTGLSEISHESKLFALLGPTTARALEAVGVEVPESMGARAGTLDGIAVHVLGEDGLAPDGVSVLVSADGAEAVLAALTAAVESVGGSVADREVAESYRVLRGQPAAGHELTEEHNPLEARLWDAVSFDKGCYVGQEVVARLRTYDKVSRDLVGLELSPDHDLPENGTPIVAEERPVGTLTSAVRLPGRRSIGLGYVKKKAIRPDLELRIGSDGPPARLHDLPFR